jgi:hypothetical protein
MSNQSKLIEKNDYSAPSNTPRQDPGLAIEGLVKFAGLDVKIKHTIKEKFVAFANQMKAIFKGKP